VTIDEAQYPVLAEFAGRLAQDHAEQEFADGLRDLLDRLATHPGAPVIGERCQAVDQVKPGGQQLGAQVS